MRKFLILLLLPSMLWAGTLTIKTPEGIQQPAGTIDRVSKRTQFGKVFERDSIGSGKFIAVVGIDPVHYLDPAGVYRNLGADCFHPYFLTGEYRPGILFRP